MLAQTGSFSVILLTGSCAVGQQKIGKAPRAPDQVAACRAVDAGADRREAEAHPKDEGPVVDPEKDKPLLDAFADTIKQATA